MGKGSSTVTNVQALPPAIEDALTEAYEEFNPFSGAFGAIDEFDPQAYTGSTMADLGGLQTSAINLAEGLASAGGPSYLNTAQTGLENIASGNTGISFDGSKLSGLLGQQNAATDTLTDIASGEIGATNPFLQTQLASALEGAANKATSQYALGGRLGSDSFADALGSGMTDAAAPILAQNLKQDQANQLAAAQALGNVSGQNLGQQGDIAQSLAKLQLQGSQADTGAQLSALGSLPGLLNADQSIISTLQNVGALQQAPQQALLDEAAAQVNQQNVLDQNQINALLSGAGMGQGMFGKNETKSGGGPSALSAGLGGALTGASLGNALAGTQLASTLGLTAANSTGLGALLGLISDTRLKSNITPLGPHKNGLMQYTWQWNDVAKSIGEGTSPPTGFLAQEAQKVYPQHVYEHTSGYLMLDYNALELEVKEAA